MLKQLSLAATFATLMVATGYAQSNKIVTIPVNRTAASSGQQMYSNYCAPCHGADGKGSGPVASVLKTPPMDLTLLSRNNNGKFPSDHVITVLQFGSEIPSHGTSQMPVWGPIMGKMDPSRPDEKSLRISNVSQYLRSIQVK
jgi:mono/diheme cytochrome c family protein